MSNHTMVPEPEDCQTLLLYTRTPALLERIQGFLRPAHTAFQEASRNALLVSVPAEQFEGVLNATRAHLSHSECAALRGTTLPYAQPATGQITRALANLCSFESLTAQVQGRALLHALQAQTFFSVYQPLLNLADGQITAYVSLLRAKDRCIEVGADRLFPMARALRLQEVLNAIGQQCALAGGAEAIRRGLLLFVKFTPSYDGGPEKCLHATVQACEQLKLPLNQLVFEITEPDAHSEPAMLRQLFAAYRSRGCRLALNDLGTAYSSLYLLAELQPEFVKLDKQLLHGARTDRFRRTLLHALTHAAHELGLRVITEGIETAADLQMAREAGSDWGQGFFLGRPAAVLPDLTPEAAEALRASSNPDTPAPKREHRRNLRVQAAGQRDVRLLYFGGKTLACKLINVSEGGCRCMAALNLLPPHMAEEWHARLRPEQSLAVEIEMPHDLPPVVLRAQIHRVEQAGAGALELGLRFRLEAAQAVIVHEALAHLVEHQFSQALAATWIGAADATVFNSSEPEPDTAGMAPPAAQPSSPALMAGAERLPGQSLEAVLVAAEMLTSQQATQAVLEARQHKESLGRSLLRKGLLTPLQLCRAFSLQSGLPILALHNAHPVSALAKTFSYLTLARHAVVPVKETRHGITLAAIEPLSERALSELAYKSGKRISLALAPDDVVLNWLSQLQPQRAQLARKATRHRVALPVTCERCDAKGVRLDEHVYYGITQDISESGYKVLGPAPHWSKHALRGEVYGMISFALIPDTVRALCQLRFLKKMSQPSPSGQTWTMGWKVINMPEEACLALKKICDRLNHWRQK